MSPARPYVIPFLLYLLGTVAAGWVPGYYPAAYAAVVVVTAVAAWLLLRGRKIVVPHRHVWGAVLVGVAGIAAWIGLSELRLEERIVGILPQWLRPSPRPGFDPFAELSPAAAWLFVAVRLAGLAVLVPLVEEMFWRGFLSRWLVSPEWEQVQLGRFTATSFVVVTLLFTAAHPEWFAAAVYCSLLNVLLIWKRDLWDCIVAHATSNLLLGTYVLTTASWRLW